MNRALAVLALNTVYLNEDLNDVLCVIFVYALDALDLFPVLEDDDCGEGGELQVVLCAGELVDVDLVGVGVVSVGTSSSFGGLGNLTSIGVEQDILVLSLEQLAKFLLRGYCLMSGLLLRGDSLNGSWWSDDGGHVVELAGIG